MTTDEPLARRKLSDLIEERLLDEISARDMAPGDVLPSERELMARFHVGRPAIREAMQNLQRLGLIDIRHGERPRVARPSLDRAVSDLGETMRHLLTHSEASLDYLKSARLVFEMEMTRIAARSRTSADIERITKVLEEQEKAIESHAEFLRLDGQFHAAIAETSRNPIFVSLSRAIFEWLSNFHAHLVRKPGLEHLTVKEHRTILAEIADGNAERAATRMKEHLERANALYRSSNTARATK